MNFQYTGSMQVSALLKIAYLNDMRGITACLPKKEGMLKKSQTTEKKLFLNSDKSNGISDHIWVSVKSHTYSHKTACLSV